MKHPKNLIAVALSLPSICFGQLEDLPQTFTYQDKAYWDTHYPLTGGDWFPTGSGQEQEAAERYMYLGPLGVRGLAHVPERMNYPSCLAITHSSMRSSTSGKVEVPYYEVLSAGPGSPADGNLLPGDFVVGVEGVGLKSGSRYKPSNQYATKDKRALFECLGDAIDVAEGTGSITFQVMRIPGGASETMPDQVVELHRTDVVDDYQERFIEVNVSSQDFLSLIAEDAGDGNGNDHSIWLDARWVHANGSETYIVDQEWVSAQVGYGSISWGESFTYSGGTTTNSIFAHASSQVDFIVPDGVTKLRVTLRNNSFGSVVGVVNLTPAVPNYGGLAQYVTNVTIPVQKIGSFKAGGSERQHKLDQMISSQAAWLMGEQRADGGFTSWGSYTQDTWDTAYIGLALLAANEPRFDLAAKDAAYYIMNQGKSDDWSSPRGVVLTFLSEYYLRSGDAGIIPGIQTWVNTVQDTVFAAGYAGHKEGVYGYDGAGTSSGFCYVAMGLAAASKTPAVLDQDTFERVMSLMDAITVNGAISYSQNHPYAPTNDSSMAGAAAMTGPCLAANNITGTSQRFLDKAKASFEKGVGGLDYGHSSQSFGLFGGTVGSINAGDSVYASHLEAVVAKMVLQRHFSGGVLVSEEMRELGTAESMFRPRMATAVHILTLAAGRKNLAITGKAEHQASVMKPGSHVHVHDLAIHRFYLQGWATAISLLGDDAPASLKAGYESLKQLSYDGPVLSLGESVYTMLENDSLAVVGDINALTGVSNEIKGQAIEMLLGLDFELTVTEGGSGSAQVKLAAVWPLRARGQFLDTAGRNAWRDNPAFLTTGSISIANGGKINTDVNISFNSKTSNTNWSNSKASNLGTVSVTRTNSTVESTLPMQVTYTVGSHSVSYTRDVTFEADLGGNHDDMRYVTIPSGQVIKAVHSGQAELLLRLPETGEYLQVYNIDRGITFHHGDIIQVGVRQRLLHLGAFNNATLLSSEVSQQHAASISAAPGSSLSQAHIDAIEDSDINTVGWPQSLADENWAGFEMDLGSEMDVNGLDLKTQGYLWAMKIEAEVGGVWQQVYQGGTVFGAKYFPTVKTRRLRIYMPIGSNGTTLQGVRDVQVIYNPNGSNYSPMPDNFIDGEFLAGYLWKERFTGLGSGTIASMTGNANYPDSPSSSGSLYSMESKSDSGDYYGQRWQGWLTPTETGSFTFYAAADDQVELYLSTDDNPANKVLIASKYTYTGSRNWSQGAVSGAINLVAGQRYFIEVLHAEGGGGDNCAIAWKRPSDSGAPANGSAPIGSAFLSTVVGGVPLGNTPPTANDATFAVSEDSPIGTAVGTVAASDPDAGDTLSYAITGGNTGGAFSIDSSGNITTATALDYETIASYSLSVTVTDSGSLTDTATITVNVSDVAESSDSDNDGLTDTWEITHFGNLTSQTGSGDADGDGLDNAGEESAGTNPNARDSDSDGFSDSVEIANGTDPNSSASLPSQLALAHWALDETGGTTAFDSSGNGYDGANTNVALNQTGIIGGAYSFDGETSRVAVPAGEISLNTNTATIVGWIKADAVQDDWIGLVDNTGTGTRSGLILKSDRELRYMWNNGAFWGWGSGLIVPADQWVLVAVAIEPGKATIYMHDGTLSSASNVTTHNIESFDGTTNLGSDRGISSRTYTGLMDDFRIYKRTLNAAEIGDLYTAGVPTNDPPVANDATFAVAEDSAIGTSVGVVIASDPDAGDTLSYAITGGNTGGAFAIDSSGNITTATALDYETISSYSLTVTVTDSGSLTDTATVTVNVTDVAEGGSTQTFANTTPVVISASGTPTITSNLTVGGMNGTISDVDVKLNITHTWDADLQPTLIAPDGTRILLFGSVGGSDDNFTDTVLDDEAGQAISAGSAPFTGSYTPAEALSGLDGKNPNGVWILEIKDTANNDGGTLNNWSLTITTDASGNSAPTANDATFAVAEDSAVGTSVGTVIASDPDVGDTLSYAITGGNTGGAFSIDSSGNITTATALDYETISSYSLTITVTDSGSLSDTATVTVNVTDVAEGSTQVFTNTTPVAISASGTPTITSNLTVGGMNGTISDVDVKLNITHTWDADLQPTLIAPDGTRILLFASVGGSDDNFTDTVLDDEAGQSISAGSAPFTGSYTPEEALSGLNGRNPNGVWTLEIKDTANNDGGTLDNWSLTITTDISGNLVPTANDATFAVAENSAVGTSVGTVSASDPDAGDILSYAITGGNTGGAFSIDNSGNITTATALDYETISSYSLTVTVTDSGSLSDTATVTVNVTDVLEVTAPVVATGGSSNITQTGVDIGYTVSDDGGEAPTVTIYWSESDGGNTPGSWSNSSSAGTRPEGSHASSITGLTEGTQYYYTVQAVNSAGESWGSTGSFTTEADSSPKLVRTTVSAVGNDSWTSVDLGQNYNSAVIVATPIYPNSSVVPVVTRIRNVSGSGFEVKIDRADGLAGAVTCDVSVIAVEEGVYTLANDGVTMEAVKFISTVTGDKNSWVAESRSYQNSYTSPVVVGQVMSHNDIDWSTFGCWGSSRTSPPSSSALSICKSVCEDPDTTRADETIGYIVIESGNGTLNGVNYTAGVGSDIVQGTGNTSTGYNYSLSGLSTASAAAVSLAGLDGGDGGWAVLYGATPFTSTQLTIAADEDIMTDSERSHTTEQVGYLVFE